MSIKLKSEHMNSISAANGSNIRPAKCGQSNTEQECLGCGKNMACIIPGSCVVTQGEEAILKEFRKK